MRGISTTNTEYVIVCCSPVMELPEPTTPLPESILECPFLADLIPPLFLKTQTTTMTETMKTAPTMPTTEIRMRLSTKVLPWPLPPVLDTSEMPSGRLTTCEGISNEVIMLESLLWV